MVTAVRLFDCRLLKIVRGADPCILWVGVPWVWRMAEAVARKFDGRCGQGRQLRISSTAMFDTRRQAWRYGREDVGAITPEFAEHDLWLQRRDVNVTAV